MERLQIERLIASIAVAIGHEIKESTKNQASDWGLYSGLLGEIVFLYYYSAFTEDGKDKLFADEILEYYLSHVCLDTMGSSLCSGMSGVLYGLHHLKTCGFADIDFTSVIPSFCKSLETIDARGFYDLMYGLSGIGIVSEKLGLSNVAEIILGKMADKFIQSDDGYYLIFNDVGTNKQHENISLSHGISGVILFLSIMQNSLSVRDSGFVANLLVNTIRYLMSNRYPSYRSVGSMFPYQSKRDEAAKSRLAWCYGDLGIGLALRSAAKTLNLEWVKLAAKELFIFNSTRLDASVNFVYDACICHGAAGISQIFRSASESYKNESSLNYVYQYWIEQVASFSCYDDGPAGYKKRIAAGYQDSYNLLEGVAGIGLCLISYLRPDLSFWEELFFMNP